MKRKRVLFRRTLLRYVRLISSQFRLSSACRLSVTMVHPTQRVELFVSIFAPLYHRHLATLMPKIKTIVRRPPL